MLKGNEEETRIFIGNLKSFCLWPFISGQIFADRYTEIVVLFFSSCYHQTIWTKVPV